jgi:TAP-like protein
VKVSHAPQAAELQIPNACAAANVDVRHWVQGILPSELDDASRHFDYFYRTCAADKACALHEPTTEGVKQRLDRILEGLKARPVIEWRWNGRYSPLPYLDTIAHARGMLDVGFRETTYFLRDAATYLAGVERVLSQTNWNHLDGWSERSALGDPDGFPEFSDVKRADPYDPDYQPAYIFRSEEITQCSDWPEPNLDIEKIQSDVKEALALSQTGGLLPKWKAWCAGATRPKKRYEGPFGGNTSFPILFLNSWDIVTPVVSAFRNSEIFPGSEVLTLDAYGHGATLESDCINAHVYAYFQNGTMPETNTTCADIPDVKYGWEGWEPESEEEEEVDDIPVDGPLIGGFRRRDARPQAEDLYEKVRSRESRLWSI